MTDRYTDLIAKLEQANEGSRLYDFDIAALNWPEGHAKGMLHRYSEWRDDFVNVPPYTTSLDAARSLSNWVLIIASDIHADGLAYVELGDPSRSPSVEVHGIHGNLILAWCIAALKARAAVESQS